MRLAGILFFFAFSSTYELLAQETNLDKTVDTNPEWLVIWTVLLSLLPILIFYRWYTKYPPFKKCEVVGPVPNKMIMPVTIAGILILATGFWLYFNAEQAIFWWGGWLSILLMIIGVVFFVTFSKIKSYYSPFLYYSSAFIALSGVLLCLFWWFYWFWLILLLLLILLIIIIIWLNIVILVCASKNTVPQPPPEVVIQNPRCNLLVGPRFNVAGVIPVFTVGGIKTVSTFFFEASFGDVAANSDQPSCCEVRLFVRWDARSARSFEARRGQGIVSPHPGFPDTAPANTWIEDRNEQDHRYGHRAGPHSNPGVHDQYLNQFGQRDQANGVFYRGRDTPMYPAAMVGQLQFRLEVIDTCNNNAVMGQSAIITLNF